MLSNPIPETRQLHLVHRRLGCPSSELLAVEVEWNRKETPQCTQTHVQHDRLYKSRFLNPGGDEFAKPVSPDILVHRDGHEYRACHGLVAVHSVCASDGRQCGNLDACCSITDNHNHL